MGTTPNRKPAILATDGFGQVQPGDGGMQPPQR